VWFRQKTLPVHQITQGDSYRRSRPFNVVETAKIIDVDTDNYGISHVRFTVQVSGPIAMDEEQRTLSVESFRNLYPEPLMA